MDGDNRWTKHYGQFSNYLTNTGIGRHSTSRPSASTIQSQLGQPALLSSHDDAVTRLPQLRGVDRMANYADYGYTGQQSYNNENFLQSNGTPQEVELQPYHPDFPRQHQMLREQQQEQGQQYLQQPPLQLSSYDPDMVYGLNQHQNQAQAVYGIVPQYSSRQPASLETLPTQFAVQPYLSPAESTGTGIHAMVSPYLTPQVDSSTSTTYNNPDPIAHSSATQAFPSTMAELTPVAATERLQQRLQLQPQLQTQPQLPLQTPQQQSTTDSTTAEEAYNQLQHALGQTLDYVRAGNLVVASQFLLKISGWLVAYARGLGT